MSEFDLREPGDPGYNPGSTSHYGRIYGKYRATVVDVDDEAQRGRVRLYIPSLTTGENVNDEDQWTWWAMPANGAGSESEDGTGTLNVPSLNSTVWCEFEMGDPSFPVYSHGFFTRQAQRAPQLGRGEDDGLGGTQQSQDGVIVPASQAGSSTYPANKVYKSPSGHIVEIDETAGNMRVRVRHPSGTFFEMTDPGDFVKQVIGDLLLWAGGKINVGTLGDFALAVGGLIRFGSTTASNRVMINNIISDFNGHGHLFTDTMGSPNILTSVPQGGAGPAASAGPSTGAVVWTDGANTAEKIRTT